MDYKIEKKPGMILTGYKRHFTGIPYGEERNRQEGEMWETTRALQWILVGSMRLTDIYCVVKNITEDGYDFYISVPMDSWTRKAIFDTDKMGMDLSELGFEDIVIPEQTYVVFESEKTKYPVKSYLKLRDKVVTEWFPFSGYEQVEGAELAIYHWTPKDLHKYIEIWIPVEKCK